MYSKFLKVTRLIKSITILGRKYSHKQGRDLVVGGQPAGGYVDLNKMKIMIDGSVSDEDFLRVQCHEVAHCIMDTTGIDQALSPMEVEIIAQSMGNGFRDYIISILKEIDK